MSAAVLVFGRRHDVTVHALMRPATEKRQGTKSREVVHLRCSGLYGEKGGVCRWILELGRFNGPKSIHETLTSLLIGSAFAPHRDS